VSACFCAQVQSNSRIKVSEIGVWRNSRIFSWKTRGIIPSGTSTIRPQSTKRDNEAGSGTICMPQNLPCPTSAEAPPMWTDDISRGAKCWDPSFRVQRTPLHLLIWDYIFCLCLGVAGSINLIITMTTFPVFSVEMCLKQWSIGGDDCRWLQLHLRCATFFYTLNSLLLVSLRLIIHVFHFLEAPSGALLEWYGNVVYVFQRCRMFETPVEVHPNLQNTSFFNLLPIIQPP